MRRQKVLNPSDRHRVDGRLLGMKSHTDLREAWRITVRCKNDLRHAKILEFPITWDEAVIVALADAIAGRGACFVHPPGELSPVGACSACGSELTATTERWRNDEAQKAKRSAAFVERLRASGSQRRPDLLQDGERAGKKAVSLPRDARR
jgi:hypothetical protein